MDMNSRWLAEEVEQDVKKRHPLRMIVLIISALVVLGGGVFAFVIEPSGGDTDNINYVAGSSSTAPVASIVPTPSVTPLPVPVNNTPVIASVPTAPSMAVTKAKLCNDVLAAARDANKFYLTQFNEARKDWTSSFAGRFDSPEAQASKAWYKNWTQSQFADYISRNDPTMQAACESKASLAGIMLQPDYDGWQ